MVRRPPQAQSDSAPQALDPSLRGRKWRHLPKWPWRQPIKVTLSYRGGPEAWVEVHARGSVGRYRGSTYLIDVLRDLTGN